MNKDKEILDKYLENIDIWYKSHNIILEKAELFYSFSLSLLNLIDETYLGKDTIEKKEDILSHYTWCFNKIIENFEKEKIFFIPQGSHFEYLWFFFYGAFYMSNSDDKTQKIRKYFFKLFTYNCIKDISEITTFTDLYKIFNQNLKKIN